MRKGKNVCCHFRYPLVKPQAFLGVNADLRIVHRDTGSLVLITGLLVSWQGEQTVTHESDENESDCQ